MWRPFTSREWPTNRPRRLGRRDDARVVLCVTRRATAQSDRLRRSSPRTRDDPHARASPRGPSHTTREAGYAEQLKSKVADMTNLGGRYGGAITAALFLTEFVDKKKPYAHIDIAGPVWSDKLGATGFGAKLVAEWLMSEDRAHVDDPKA